MAVGPKRIVTLRGIKTVRVSLRVMRTLVSEEDSYPKRD